MRRILGLPDVEAAIRGGSIYAAGGGGWVEHGRMLGTAVVSGMLAATLLGVFIIPALFVFVERLSAGRGARAHARDGAPEALEPGAADPAHAE